MKKPRHAPTGHGLRIVAGSLRGSRLHVPDRPGLRPTSDRVRETLFNWLQTVIEDAHCLDLYAGTGALGIEALSRGAASCVFVERDRTLAALIENNLARLNVERGRVVVADAIGFLETPDRAFDLVFLDPPFDADLWTASAEGLERNGWLCESAFSYVETPGDVTPDLPHNWVLHRKSRAGAVDFALYRRVGLDPLS